MACLSVACLCAAWSAAHARQRADDAVLQPRARVVHAGADRSTQCSRACSSLRPCSALRPPPPFDQTSAKVGSQDDWPARVELAVHRRSAPRPTAAQRAWHVRTSAFWPQQLRPPLEGPHTYAVGGNVGDPAARIVMADLCDVHPFVRTRARRLARCTTCRSARVQTRAKDKIAPVLIRGGVGAYRSKIASDG